MAGPLTLPVHCWACCAGCMRIGAKIMLDAQPDTVRDGLAVLAGSGWMMILPRQDPYSGHPAGRARPGRRVSGSGPELVAVMFGTPPPGPAGTLPVQWESVAASDAFGALLLMGEITVKSARGHAALALAGSCQLLAAAGGEQARLEVVKEAARSFITSVAVTIAGSPAPGQEKQPPGPARAWLTGHRSAA